jgi:hypothetical protein
MKVSSLFFVAGLAVAILSIAPANVAQPANAAPTSFRSVTGPWVGCSGSSGMYSPTCRNVGNWKTYAACMEDGPKIGWRSSENSWYCTSLSLK